MNNQYSFDGEFIEEGLMKIFPQKGKVRNAIAWYLRKIRKGAPIDPVTGALAAGPGGIVLAPSFVKVVDPHTRARVVKLALERPDKAAITIIKGTPKTAAKTVVNIPSATTDAVMSTQDKVIGWLIKHGIDPSKLSLKTSAMIPIR